MTRQRKRRSLSPAMRAQVIETWGNECWLQLPGCTHVGAEDDHIIPFSAGGMLTVANIRRACGSCNVARSNRVLSGYGATIHAVIGPPAGGKTTYVRDHAQPGDLVLDWDMLADALTMGDHSHHSPAPTVVSAATGAWQGAYMKLVRESRPVGVWIIKSIPATHAHPRMLDEWIALDYDIVVCDPGTATVFDTLAADHRNQGARATARKWYGMHLSAELIARRQAKRREELVRLGLRAPETSQSSSRPAW